MDPGVVPVFRKGFISYRMNSKAQRRCFSVHQDFSPGMFARVSLISLLLVAVVGLSTLAKDGQYFPRTNPANHVSLSIKMNVAHAPILISMDRQQPIAAVAPPPPVARVTRLEQFEATPVRKISVTVSMQHRSPPLSLF